MKHDVHLRLELQGGRTNYDGVYAVSKESKLAVEKSKISPIIEGLPIIIDITQGGVIDRVSSLISWMTELTSPPVFKKAAWWSIEDWCYGKYKPYWDKFEGMYPKFRQAKLYELGHHDNNFINLLKLIWIDLLSDRYVLQRDVIKPLRDKTESELIVGLGMDYEDIYPKDTTSTNNPDLDIGELLGVLEDTTKEDN